MQFQTLIFPSYAFIHNNSHTKAGMVAMYILSMIQYNLVADMHMNITGCKNIWINIPKLNLIIGTIYKHSKNDIQIFNDILNSNLEQLKSNKVFLLGYINIGIEATSTNCMR